MPETWYGRGENPRVRIDDPNGVLARATPDLRVTLDDWADRAFPDLEIVDIGLSNDDAFGYFIWFGPDGRFGAAGVPWFDLDPEFIDGVLDRYADGIKGAWDWRLWPRRGEGSGTEP